MKHYREVLYRDYSASFGAQKALQPAIQHTQYDATYHRLPQDRNCVIADLGCGKGEWLGWLSAKGFTKLTGVDGSLRDLAIARQHGPATVQWLQQDIGVFLAKNSARFDLLHAKDVVEHLTKDEFIAFLQAAYDALRPGGQLWLLTFNAQSPLSAATRYGDFTHEIALTPASFAQCLRACGFNDISVAGRHYCSPSVGGRLRAALGSIAYKAARFMLKIRHGAGGAPDSAVDLHTAHPDLFACATKPL